MSWTWRARWVFWREAVKRELLVNGGSRMTDQPIYVYEEIFLGRIEEQERFREALAVAPFWPQRRRLALCLPPAW